MLINLNHDGSSVIDRPPLGEKVLYDDTQKEKVDPPRQYAVLALNDNTTPHHFVMGVLCSHFNLSTDKARIVMRNAERDGRALVRLYPKDIAESKAEIANQFARNTENPIFGGSMELTFICEPV